MIRTESEHVIEQDDLRSVNGEFLEIYFQTIPFHQGNFSNQNFTISVVCST